MNLPEKCPACGIKYNIETTRAFLIQRTDPDWDSDVDGRIEDQIFECSKCHTLFRARWRLIDFVQLIEKE